MTTETTKAEEKLSKRGQVREISIDSIDLDPEQPRKNKPEAYIEELGNSIAKYGLMNFPHVEKIEDSKPVRYKMVNGECRLLAFRHNEELKAIGKISCIVRDYSDKTASEKFLEQILDNEVRLEMGAMEKIDAYQTALDKGATIEQLSDAVGKSVETIMSDLPLTVLSEPMRAAVDAGLLPKKVAREVAKVGQEHGEAKMDKAYTAAMRARKTDQMLANVNQYKCQLGQGELEIKGEDDDKAKTEEKGTTDLKKAGGQLTAFMNTVTRFSNLKTSRTLMIKARSKAVVDGKIQEVVKEMKRQADLLSKADLAYRAKLNLKDDDEKKAATG